MAEQDWAGFPVKITEDGKPVIAEPLHWEYRREGSTVHVRTVGASGAEMTYSYQAD